MYSYPVPYLAFLAHFHIDRDYFECHELLEEHWKETDGARDSIWVGFIQSAVFLYHYRRGNTAGALRMAQKTLRCFSRNEQALIQLGIDPEQFLFSIRQAADKMKNGAPFKPIAIPITDERLEKEFRHFAKTFHPELNERFLTDKHLLRDRTDVLEARAAAIALKKAGKMTM
ncbi:DUF309 domain-containing protein [Domibacillus sp. A3M-37]|uniref:DUF309 domain-containing protein n=1 Tax=Domibacillus TaxID=1433999 RepID=UPI0020B7C9AD|nr:DUF309 domain-containing protein [Domibacillus sp. A3M-37]MCP3763237.1 DUF309 domain-containing protein [Domibacillus sp. A3M-37]